MISANDDQYQQHKQNLNEAKTFASFINMDNVTIWAHNLSLNNL